jgi:hypothetical protein
MLIADMRNAYKYLVGKSGSRKSVGIAQSRRALVNTIMRRLSSLVS